MNLPHLVWPPLIAAATLGAAGDWPMWRHDARLTGFQPLPGTMKRPPRVLAKHFVGAGQGAATFADLRGSGRADEVVVSARARLTAYDKRGRRLWESAPDGYVMGSTRWVEDLDGDGILEVVATAGRMGGTRQAYLILDSRTGKLRGAIPVDTGDFGTLAFCGAYVPGQRGKQVFVLTSQRQTGPNASNGQLSLWSFDGKGVERRWAYTPPEFPLLYANALIGDLDGDGHLHAVVDSWCRVWNVDLATGAVLSFTTWDPQGTNQRHYGWNQLVDVDGDGRLDYVNTAIPKHVDVLRNVGGRLELAWTRGWPDPVTTEARSLCALSDPAADIDGDGRMELAAGLFDGLTDRRWHLFVWDAATGRQRLEALDLVPLASIPLWGDKGGRALLCARSATLDYAHPQAYEVWRLQGDELSKLWSSPDAPLLEGVPGSDTLAPNTNGWNPRRAVTADVDGDGRPEFVTRPSPDGGRQAWGIDAAGALVAKAGQPAGVGAGQPAPSAASEPALRLPKGQALSAAKGAGPPQARALPPKLPRLQGTQVPYLLAADLDGSGGNELLLYDNRNVTVLSLSGRKLEARESVPSSEVPVVCDLLGDGAPHLLLARRGADSNLRVAARGPNGQERWRFVFPDSGPCGQYSERPHYLVTGHFTGGKHLDVFTYSTKPAARAYVLDGRTGVPVWQREEVPKIERHFQAFGGRASVWDFSGDGADDILFLNPDYYCIADGRTGDLLVGPVSISAILTWWAAYASPAVLAREGAPPVVYLGGAYSSRGSIALDGSRELWHEVLPTERWPLAIGSERFAEGLLPPSGSPSGLREVVPGSGPPHGVGRRATVASGNRALPTAGRFGWRAGQVEADGTFVCFDAATGKRRWSMALPTAPSGIVTGDVDGDGEPEFLLGGQDGSLLAVRDAGDRGEVLWRKEFGAPVGTPLLADLNGDGKSEIAVSVGDGYVYVLGP